MDMIDSTDKDEVSMTNDLNSEGTGMSTPQTSVMMMASFRIDREVWAKFGAIAKRERLNATEVLTEYIQRCTDNDRTEYAVRIDTDTSTSTDTYDTDKFNEAVMTAVLTLSLCSHDDVSKRIDDAIDNRVSPLIEAATLELVKTSTVEQLVKVDIEPLTNSIVELETYTQSQFKAVRDELKKSLDCTVTTVPIAIDTTATPGKKKADEDGKTWCGFFEMVGIEAMTALEAQKKQYTNTRAEQIERGIQAAREQGLGEWIVKRAGRSFVRVGD